MFDDGCWPPNLVPLATYLPDFMHPSPLHQPSTKCDQELFNQNEVTQQWAVKRTWHALRW
jgi:hypothetical protein